MTKRRDKIIGGVLGGIGLLLLIGGIIIVALLPTLVRKLVEQVRNFFFYFTATLHSGSISASRFNQRKLYREDMGESALQNQHAILDFQRHESGSGSFRILSSCAYPKGALWIQVCHWYCILSFSDVFLLLENDKWNSRSPIRPTETQYLISTAKITSSILRFLAKAVWKRTCSQCLIFLIW